VAEEGDVAIDAEIPGPRLQIRPQLAVADDEEANAPPGRVGSGEVNRRRFQEQVVVLDAC